MTGTEVPAAVAGSEERIGEWRGYLLSAARYVLLALVAAAIVVARRPDALTNPQFWAEDGQFYYADAYNHGGAHALLMTYAGYLGLLQRLVAAVAIHLGITGGALLFNLVGIACQILPALILVSRRAAAVIPSARARYALGTAYLLMPSFELNVTLTNAQWHLGVAAFLILMIGLPAGRMSRLFDALLLAITCFTGVFAFLLLPVAAFRLVATRLRWFAICTGISAVAAICQAVVILTSPRPHVANLGASPATGLALFVDRILLQGIFGEEGHQNVFTYGVRHGLAIAIVLGVAAAVLLAAAVTRGPAALRLFIAFSLLVVLAGVVAPNAGSDAANIWPQFARGSNGERYFFMAQLAVIASVVWLITRLPRIPSAVAGVACAACFLSGLVTHPQYPPYADLHPSAYQAALDQAPHGTNVVVPINPPGWSMTLTRR